MCSCKTALQESTRWSRVRIFARSLARAERPRRTLSTISPADRCQMKSFGTSFQCSAHSSMATRITNSLPDTGMVTTAIIDSVAEETET